MNRTRARVTSLFGGFVVLAAAATGLALTTATASAQPSTAETAETARCDGTQYYGYFILGQGGVKDLQPFTASVGGPPASVDVRIGRANDRVTEPVSASIRAFDDTTGQPGTVVASAVVPASAVPRINGATSPLPATIFSFTGATALTAGGRYALELSTDGDYDAEIVTGSTCGPTYFSENGNPYRAGNPAYTLPLVARVAVAPPQVTAASVRGGGTLTADDGKRYSIAVDARATTMGQASGKFSLAGGGPDTTAGSRTVTSVSKTAGGGTVTGTAGTSAGKPVSFTLTVTDGPGGRDRVSVQLGDRTVNGVLTNGDITTG